MRQDGRHGAASGEGLMSTPARRASGAPGQRVAVVTSSLNRGYNALWEATRPHVSDLWIIGANSPSACADGSSSIALREVGTRKGLVWRHLVGLRRLLRTLEPDLIHVNAELWTVTVQETLGLPFPVVVHGAENIWDHGNPIEQAMRRQLVHRAVRHIAGYASWNTQGTDHIRILSQRVRGRAVPTLAIPAVVPPASFREVHWAPARLENGACLEVLLVGRMIAMKGFDGVIRAGAALGRPVRISLCGAGPDLPRLRETAEREGVTLRELGVVPAPELAALMAASHVMVQPSLTTPEWSEQFGRSVAEAMTVGLPCLVSDSGELPNVVGHDPRAVFREGDIDDMGQRLRSATRDDDALKSLSTDQHLLAHRWQPEVAAAAMLDFWRDCLL